jgi:hypothetical protein
VTSIDVPVADTDAASPVRLSALLRSVLNHRIELRRLFWLVAVVGGLMLLPMDGDRVHNAAGEAISLAQWYAREHIILCLIPALFIAGAISVFVRQSAVMRFLGPRSNKPLAYAVGAVSGAILSVCSCTVLPLFAGIWRKGAGLGPAIAFLFSGPAINVLAIILTARVLGLELGIARGVGAIAFSVVIGLLMAWFFAQHRDTPDEAAEQDSDDAEPIWPTVLLLVSLTAILVFANWSEAGKTGLFGLIGGYKWWLVTGSAAMLSAVVVWAYGVDWRWLAGSAGVTGTVAAIAPQHPELPFIVGSAGLTLSLLLAGGTAVNWVESTWEFTRQIVPLLLIGVLVAGFLLGRPGHEGLMPSAWIAGSVGGSSVTANFVASFAGAFMYFATLTEVPIVQGLVGAGMGQGPALALLLAGPALSLPSMLVLRSVMGWQKTLVYCALVVAMATLCGIVFGALA